jgi:CspA family cold shock protein
MKTGTVKIWNVQKGFGFIISDETEDEIYVGSANLHVSVINKRLHEGQKVKFDIKYDLKGDRAVNVHVLR